MVRKILTYIILTFLAVNALAWFVTSIKFILYPYSIDFGEGILLSQSAMISKGQNIYPPITDYPYIVSNYHPFFPFLNSLFYHFTSPALWTGRLISLLSVLGSMTLICMIVYKFSKRLSISLLAALTPLCLSFPYNWTFLYRVDMPGIFLSLLGLYLYIYPPRKGGIYISIIPFTLAFLTKLNFVLAPIACVIDLLCRPEKNKFRFIIILIISLIVPYLVIDLATGNGLFKHTFIYTVNEFHRGRMFDGYRDILDYTLFLICALIIGITQINNRIIILLSSYVVLVFLSLATYGAEGSDSNYFLEYIFVLSLFMGFSLSRLFKANGNQSTFSCYGLALIFIVLFVLNGRILHGSEFIPIRSFNRSIESGKQIDQFVRSCPGDVISEDATFLARNGKPMLFQPYIMSLLSRKGKWDQTNFVNDIKNKRFKMIILRFDVDDPNNTDKPGVYQEAGFDRFTEEMEKAIAENYTVLQPITMLGNSWYIYIPEIS